MIGRIVYYPKTEATDIIIGHMNETFQGRRNKIRSEMDLIGISQNYRSVMK